MIDAKGATPDAPRPEPEVNIPATMGLKQIFVMLLLDCSEALRATLMSLLMTRLKEWICDYMLGIAGPPADFIARLAEQLGIQLRLLKGLPAQMFAGAYSSKTRSWTVAGPHRFTKIERQLLPSDYDGGKALLVVVEPPEQGTALLIWGNDAIVERRAAGAIWAMLGLFDRYSRNWAESGRIVQEHTKTVGLLDQSLKEVRESLRETEVQLDDQFRESAELLKSLETATRSCEDETLIVEAQQYLAGLKKDLTVYLKGRRSKAAYNLKGRLALLEVKIDQIKGQRNNTTNDLKALLPKPKGVKGVILVGVGAPKS